MSTIGFLAMLPLLLLTFTCLTQAQFTGDLRLVDSTSRNAHAGRLEIFLQGQWGTVCDDGFDLSDARVACIQLGYNSAEREGNVANLNFPQANSSTRIWLDNVRCKSTDKSLLACSHDGLGNHNCVHSEDVAIVCSGGAAANNGALRLVNSTSTNATAGRLEIFLHGKWGTVCDDGFGTTEANVVCHQLGLPPSTSVDSVDSLGYYPGLSTAEIWLDNVDCTNSATTLLACNHRGIGIEDCVHSEDVAVVCGSFASYGDLRLVGSSSAGRGRLEIFLRDEWGTVCDDSFGTTEGNVACQQLGYNSASHVGNVGRLGYSQASYSTEIWLDNVDCSSHDSTLLSCGHRGIGVHNCAHSEDVALVCSTMPARSTSAVSGGVVAGIIVAVMFALFTGLPVFAFCIYIISKKNGNRRGRNRQFQSSPGAAAAIAASTTTGSQQHAPYPTVFMASQQGQQAPPPHAYPHQQQPGQPSPHSALHKAPPPTYSQATAHPPPAYSAQSSGSLHNCAAYPTAQPLHCASSTVGTHPYPVQPNVQQQPLTGAPYPVQPRVDQPHQHTVPSPPPTSPPYPVQPRVQQPQQHTSPSTYPVQPSVQQHADPSAGPPTYPTLPVQDLGYAQPSVQQPQQSACVPSGPPTSAPYPDQPTQPQPQHPACLPAPTSVPYHDQPAQPQPQQPASLSAPTSAPYPDQPAKPQPVNLPAPTSAPYSDQPAQPQPQQPASLPAPTSAPYPDQPVSTTTPDSQQPPQNPGFSQQTSQNPQQAQDFGYAPYPPPTYPTDDTPYPPNPAP